MNTVYSVSAAADLLSVSVSTIRRICADMADILPDYQPAPGQTRTLSEADVRTISAILTRLQARPGLTRSALLAELSTGQGEPLIVPAELPTRQPQNAPDSPGRAIAPPVVSDSLAQSHAALQNLSALGESMARIEAQLSARIDAMAVHPVAERPADSLSLVAAAVAVGVLIGALVAAAVWQNSAAVVVCVAVALIAVLVSIIAPLRR